MRTPVVMPMMPQKMEAIMKRRTEVSSYWIVVVMVAGEDGKREAVSREVEKRGLKGFAGGFGGVGSDGWRRLGDGGRRRYSRIEVEWQEGISLRTGAPAAAHFHGKAQDENPGKAGGEEDGKRQHVHGRETKEPRCGIASPDHR